MCRNIQKTQHSEKKLAQLRSLSINRQTRRLARIINRIRFAQEQEREYQRLRAEYTRVAEIRRQWFLQRVEGIDPQNLIFLNSGTILVREQIIENRDTQ